MQKYSSIPRRPAHLALTLCACAALAACGGDPKQEPPPASPTMLSGTAAIGAPMAGATVTVIDSDPATADPAAQTAASDGSFSVDVSGLKAPLLVRATATVDGESVQHVAVLSALTASATNTANVTPLTTAVATLVAPGGDTAALATPATLATAATATSVGNATQLLVNTLNSDPATAALLGSNFNPMSTPFTANGQGVDAALERVSITTAAGGTVEITNNAAPAGSNGAPATVTLTPAQTATPAVAPALPASVPSGDIPTAAELKALGDKYQACINLPVSQRVTLDAQGDVTAVLGACDFVPSDWRSNGRNFVQEVGQFTLARNLVTNARLGVGQIALALPPQNLTDPKEFKHPYCNSGPCVVARWPMTTASGRPTRSDWVLGKVNGQWNFVGNQRPYRVYVEARLQRKVNMNRDGPAAGNTADPYFFKDRYESMLRLVFDLSVATTSDVRAVRFTGPGLPPAGVVQFRSQACGTDDRMGLAYQNGSTRTLGANPVLQFWTSASGTEFTLAAANLDGTPLATPVPVNNTTTASFQSFTPVALGDLRSAVPNWAVYKVEIFKFSSASETPDEVIYLRNGIGPENPSVGPTVDWPVLTAGLADDHLLPAGAQAGTIDSFAGRTLGWTIGASSYVTSGYLFGSNFATATNAQNETAGYSLRGRVDYEPAALGDLTAAAWRLASPVAGTSLSPSTANSGTNPNPRCGAAVLPPLTTTTSDYREIGVFTRGPDRQLRQAIWFWDN
ncbi:MAG: hypothetical protein HZC37_18095 [Burkholderiales bacterium]|nr:hypothetical protein [Burkholderiales bacterium]